MTNYNIRRLLGRKYQLETTAFHLLGGRETTSGFLSQEGKAGGGSEQTKYCR